MYPSGYVSSGFVRLLPSNKRGATARCELSRQLLLLVLLGKDHPHVMACFARGSSLRVCLVTVFRQTCIPAIRRPKKEEGSSPWRSGQFW